MQSQVLGRLTTDDHSTGLVLGSDSIDSVEEKKDKRKDHAKKFFLKKDSKDKGYSAFTGEASQDSVFLVNTK